MQVISGLKARKVTAPRCLGGRNNSCAEGHTGRLCADCDGDFVQGIFGCDDCDPKLARKWLFSIGIITVLLAVPIGVGVMYWVVADKDSTQFLVYFRILFDHVQLLSINADIMANWPVHLLTTYKASQTTTFNFNFVSVRPPPRHPGC